MEDIDVDKVSQELLNWALNESKMIVDYDIHNWYVTLAPTEESANDKFKDSMHKVINCHTDTQAQRVLVAFYRKTGRKTIDAEIKWIQEYLWGSYTVLYYKELDSTQLK